MIDNGDGTFTDPSTGVIYDANMNPVGNVGGIAPVGPVAVGAGMTSPTSPSGGSWYSNLGTLFSNLGTAAVNIYHGVSGTGVSTINPRTGQPYTQAQLTALAQQNAALNQPVVGGIGLMPLILIGLVVILLMRR